MEAPDKWLYEYATVRFVPRIDREEFLNIGLVMMCKRQKWLKGQIFVDEARVKGFCPKADMETLKNQAILFEKKDVPGKDLPVEEKYRWLTSAKSAILQTSPSHPGIITRVDEEVSDSERLEKEFSRLFKELVL